MPRPVPLLAGMASTAVPPAPAATIPSLWCPYPLTDEDTLTLVLPQNRQCHQDASIWECLSRLQPSGFEIKSVASVLSCGDLACRHDAPPPQHSQAHARFHEFPDRAGVRPSGGARNPGMLAALACSFAPPLQITGPESRDGVTVGLGSRQASSKCALAAHGHKTCASLWGGLSVRLA
eukprot:3363215-Rhodomonas_salina.1